MSDDHILPSPNEAGRSFEEQVAAIYRSLGYTVTRNKTYKGQEVDIMARQAIPGSGEIALAIECKYRRDGVLSNQDVYDFLGGYRQLLQGGQATKCVLVCNRKVSDSAANALLDEPNFLAIPFSDLQRQALDPAKALLQYVHRYEASEIFQRYVDPDLHIAEMETQPNYVPRDVRPRSRAALDFIRLVLDAGSRPRLFILADFGAGKTTLLQHVKYIVARRYLDGTSAVVPLLLRLSSLDQYPSLNDFILDGYYREVGTRLEDVARFWELVAASSFVFLLDGFDEASVKADEHTRGDLLARLGPLVRSGCHVILSSRPNYFVSYREFERALARIQAAEEVRGDDGKGTAVARLVGLLTPPSAAAQGQVGRSDLRFLRCHIDRLTPSQIDQYLSRLDADFQRVTALTWQEVRDRLYDIYDLPDLMTRPLLLEMITTTVLEGGIDLSEPLTSVTQTDLYSAYVHRKLQLDRERSNLRRHLTSITDRMSFAEYCAVWLCEHERSTVDLGAMAGIVRQAVGGRKAADESSAVLTDLRTSSFLTIDEFGGLRFVHRSFQEFFLAQWMSKALAGRTSSTTEQVYGLLRHPTTWETLNFLSEMLKPDAAQQINETIQEFADDRNEGVLLGNLVSLLLYAQRECSLPRQGVSLVDRKFPDLRIGPGQSEDVRLVGCECRLLTISGLVFRGNFKDTTVDELALVNAKCELTLLDSPAGLIRLTASDVTVSTSGMTGSAVAVEGSDVALFSSEGDNAISLSAVQSVVRLNTVGSPIEVVCEGSLLDAHLDHGEGSLVIPRLDAVGSLVLLSDSTVVSGGSLLSSLVIVEAAAARSLCMSCWVEGSVVLVIGGCADLGCRETLQGHGNVVLGLTVTEDYPGYGFGRGLLFTGRGKWRFGRDDRQLAQAPKPYPEIDRFSDLASIPIARATANSVIEIEFNRRLSDKVSLWRQCIEVLSSRVGSPRDVIASCIMRSAGPEFECLRDSIPGGICPDLHRLVARRAARADRMRVLQ